MSAPPIVAAPTFAEAFGVWLKIGLLGFGGPAGQIALMHRVLVDEKKWIDEPRFLHALNFCMLLPGPEAQQLAIYIGWLLHRVWGGVVAGVLFVLPGALVILALSMLYVSYADLAIVEGVFFGVKAAVIAVVAEAVVRIARRALKNDAMRTVALVSFLAIFLFAAPFPVIVLAAGIVGALGARVRPHLFAVHKGHGEAATAPLARLGGERARGAWIAAAVAAMAWIGPVALLVGALGADHVFAAEATFFSKMAVVTFGGAYAVLAYVAQEAVATYGWLQPGEMIDGLGLAETTPGPLVLVLQFVGFVAAFRAETGLDPLLAGAIGAGIATWVTFAPCFVWIFAGAPLIERLRGARVLNAALATITAAVVGVVLNLAVWFAAHVVFREVGSLRTGPLNTILPDIGSFDALAAGLAVAAMLALLRFKAGMLKTLAAAAALGAGLKLAGLV